MDQPGIPAAAGVALSPHAKGLQSSPGRSACTRVAKYHVPEVLFGLGSLDEIGHAALRLGARRPMLVTDAGVWEAGWSVRARRHLDAVGLAVTTWADVTPNPRDSEVRAGAERYREQQCDVLVAVGGGSCIDAAKGIAVMVSNDGDILDYAGVDKLSRPLPPMIASPTTAGTGADVSQFAVITDRTRRVKVTLLGRELVPHISLTDPQTLSTVPDWLAATTGLDALTHGIESFVSRGASFLTDRHALYAMDLVRRHLRRSVDEPCDVAAQTGMAGASLSAGLAFTNALLGATHAISHQVGGVLDLPHGVLNALLLPHVVRFNAEECRDRFRPIARMLGLDGVRMPAADLVDAIVDAIVSLSSYLGVPKRLHDLGVRREDLPAFAVTAMEDACITTNPRPVTEADVLSLLSAAY